MAQSRSSLGGYALLFVVAGTIALVGLGIMGSAGSATVSTTSRKASTYWLEGNNVQVRNDLTIRQHADKHGTAAWEIYAAMLTGKCAASMTYCGGSDQEWLHICELDGIVGAVLQFGSEITTGFYEGNVGYWQRRIEREGWRVCQ